MYTKFMVAFLIKSLTGRLFLIVIFTLNMFYVQVFTLLLNYTGFCTNNFNLYSGFVVFNSYILFDITFDLITQQTVSNCILHCKMNGLIEKHLCTKQTKCYTQHNKLYTSLKTVHYIHYTENRTEMYT